MKKIEIFAPDDICFVINGKEWYIPGDVDAKTIFELLALSKKLEREEDDEAGLKLIQKVKELFSERHSKEEVEQLKLGFSAISQIIQSIMDYTGESIKNMITRAQMAREKK